MCLPLLFACIKLDFLALVAIYFDFREVNVRKSYLGLIVYMYTTFLVHRIRISEIYPGIENLSYPCYLTQDVKLRHPVQLHLSVFLDFWKLILKKQINK